jgi:hypothetical protein
MPGTIKLGSSGADVKLCQESLNKHGFSCLVDGDFGPKTEGLVRQFQATEGLLDDGVVGAATWTKLLASSQNATGALYDWDKFYPLLASAQSATYDLTDAQVPTFPPGVDFLPSRFLGEDKTNCTMFTSYLIGNGFGIPFSVDQWKEWQVAKGATESIYRGYGPAVTSEWGVGQIMPQGALPIDGVYLIQSFSRWPRGHSWLVIDYDQATDQVLTLESNTAGFGLDGVGFAGLGPLRTADTKDWKSKVKTTWKSRTRTYSQIFMAKLSIDHASVLAWLEK